MKFKKHYSLGLRVYLLAPFMQLLLLNPIYSQQNTMESSWISLNPVYEYDSLYSYTMNLVKDDKVNVYAPYKIPKYLVGKDNYRIRPIIFDWSQYHFAKYNKRKLSYYELLKVDPYVDTAKLIKDELNNFLAVLIYITPGEKHFVFDKNKDFDFSNDSIYSFSLQHISNQSTENWEQYSISINDTFDLVINKKIQRQKFQFFIFPFKSPYLEISAIDEYFFEFSDPIKLYKSIDRSGMLFYLDKSCYDTNKYVSIKILDENGKLRSKRYYSGNTFSYKGKKYIIDSIDKTKNRINLRNVSTAEDNLIAGREVNFFFSDHISGVNQFGKPIATNKYGDKYLLVDFWATWCVPCKESLPILAEIYQKYKHVNFSLLSISVDDPSATQKVKQFIKTHNMNWDVMMPSKKVKMKSSGFAEGGIPKFVLLNPEGRIIKIANGLFELPEMQSKLRSIFQGNK